EIDLRQRGDRQPQIPEPAAQHDREGQKRGRDRPPDDGRRNRGAHWAASERRLRRPSPPPPPPRRRCGCATGSLPGAGTDSALVTVTFEPAVSRAKPVVTTRSPAFRPLAMTDSVSFCWETVTGRTVTVLSACTANTKVPLGPRWTAAVGTTTACRNVSIKSRTLTNWPGQSWNCSFGNSALSLMVPVV